jgi:hypothetical protein
MLDLDHPMTRHIFAASGAEDRVLERAKRMTVASSPQRLKLREACQADLEKMRQLNRGHFKASPFIFEAIDELEAALQTLATLRGGAITEDKSDGEGQCPGCGAKITKFKTNSLSREYFERTRHLKKEDENFIVSIMPLPSDFKDLWHIYCDKCLDFIMPAREKLSSAKGFGTDFI